VVSANRLNNQIEVFENDRELVEALAKKFEELAKAAINEYGRFIVSLSGGSTPKIFYERLAEQPYAGHLQWDKILFFLGDERCVPHDHPDSNFSMINRALFTKVAIPESNIFPTIHQDTDPDGAAAQYEETLRRVYAAPNDEVPSFDLILLGLGPDGHTASLFPETKALKESKKLYVANFIPKFDGNRISMSYPLINAGKEICFIVTGDNKASILKDVLERPDRQLPSQVVQPKTGKLVWLVDRAAVRLLQ
jgi:6-phosphogluconolactonase